VVSRDRIPGIYGAGRRRIIKESSMACTWFIGLQGVKHAPQSTVASGCF
jgi:hypothetical protein